ncbi:MAG: hypothetical protein ACK5DE_02465 [Bacteroidota bacterium]|jgi:hypothetical protein
MKKQQLENNVFGNLSVQEVAKLRDSVIKDSSILLRSELQTASKEVITVSEALVAYDTAKGVIVKLIAANVPRHANAAHEGFKFLISRNQDDGSHRPVMIYHHGENEKNGKRIKWNPWGLVAYIDYSKLPMNCSSAEFRILRAYRAGMRSPHRFELLSFAEPTPGEQVNRERPGALKVEAVFNNVPPIRFVLMERQMYGCSRQAMLEIGKFAGVSMEAAFGLQIKDKVDKAVVAGDLSMEVAEDILHDHSEDPVEVAEPLAQDMKDFGKKSNMMEDEEGRDFYVPDNPLVKTMAHKGMEAEEEVELLD